MIFEIINPSDKMTIEADSTVVAGVAVLYLTEGQAGLKSKTGKTVLPIMMFAEDDELNVWLSEMGVGTLDDLRPWMMKHKDEVAAALESIVYGSFDDRERLMASLGKATHMETLQAISSWNEKRRSSANDYSRAAFFVAKRIRSLEAEDV